MTDGLSVHVSAPFDAVVAQVRDALKEQGFGVLTEIDIKATMKAKLDADVEDYVILGACNPPLAKQALDLDRHVGVFLPCNVVVRADAGRTLVEVVNPMDMVTATGTAALDQVAEEATRRLQAAVAAVASAPTSS